MKRAILISLVCVIGVLTTFSQGKDQISLVKKRFYVNERQLSNTELKTMLKSTPESAAMLGKATTNQTIGTVLVGVGTVSCLVGATMTLLSSAKQASDVSSGKSSSSSGTGLLPVVVGAGFVFAGLPFILTGSKQLTKSVNLYNAKHTSANSAKTRLDFSVAPTGLRMAIRF